FRMVKAVFAQRRKTAANSISAGMSLPKETVYAAIAQAGYTETVRAESFTMEELALLANAIYNIMKQ
ncbi:MAG: 16S rRNA (adenine(1518)-N(6)/adenine(1519)-N(6))-dimethyltransferase, partial [Clostridia bacterium]|nr:16S rRNA (adenine(1518)-N(6)/adenine(1519)-N(6))-dimethyltransferase [Clostridia bacterium]